MDSLKIIADLPKSLEEVSGIETTFNSDVIWMLNDGGNKSELFGVNKKGKIEKIVKINAKNHDWEDLTSDPNGNLYIGDFGNNSNKRKNLTILKVKVADLKSDEKIDVERINFKYPDQKSFPPKKNQMYFDCESFFFYNDSLYIFTKSRTKSNFGKTSLYKVPAKRGNHIATYINSFQSCSTMDCWITAADISNDGKKVILLNHKSVWLFTGFNGDDFFSGKSIELPFETDPTQKEGVCFKDENTVYVTDEDEGADDTGRNLYLFSLTGKGMMKN